MRRSDDDVTPPCLHHHKRAFSGNGELCGMDDVTCEEVDGFKLLPDNRHAEMRRAYYSVVTFMDSQLGRVLDTLEATRLNESTAIVFWGDHGYQVCPSLRGCAHACRSFLLENVLQRIPHTHTHPSSSPLPLLLL